MFQVRVKHSSQLIGFIFKSWFMSSIALHCITLIKSDMFDGRLLIIIITITVQMKQRIITFRNRFIVFLVISKLGARSQSLSKRGVSQSVRHIWRSTVYSLCSLHSGLVFDHHLQYIKNADSRKVDTMGLKAVYATLRSVCDLYFWMEFGSAPFIAEAIILVCLVCLTAWHVHVIRTVQLWDKNKITNKNKKLYSALYTVYFCWRRVKLANRLIIRLNSTSPTMEASMMNASKNMCRTLDSVSFLICVTCSSKRFFSIPAK